MLQIFRGVAFLHEANLIHGSLHAGSVFVTPAGKYHGTQWARSQFLVHKSYFLVYLLDFDK